MEERKGGRWKKLLTQVADFTLGSGITRNGTGGNRKEMHLQILFLLMRYNATINPSIYTPPKNKRTSK